MPKIQHLSGWEALNEFIEQVNARLEMTGMTITTLAEETGISRQHLYRILTGEHNLSMAAAQSIAEVLGLKIATVKA
jgi:DNA-binding phage protein